jgi:mannosyltransferase
LPKERNTKSVVTVYDFTYERYFPLKQKLIHSWQKFRAIREADMVLCISESTRRDLLNYLPDVDPRKTRVTHLAANQIFFEPSVIQRPDILNMQAVEDGYVLFVGARSTYKNFLPLVHALEGSHLHLVCVGGGAFSALERSECDARLLGRHHHIGWAEDAALKTLYTQAVGLVFPSLYEGFGIPIVEAMASGCPVVASNVSSLPEVAGDAGILLDKLDADSIRSAIRHIQEPGRRVELIALGKERAPRFTWQKCVDDTLRAYADLGVSW